MKNLLFNSYASLLLLILLILFFQSSSLAQQKGIIAGKVVDSQTGEAIVGANVIIENTNIGSATDLEGNFKISNVDAGRFNLIVSYISYSKTILKDVEVNENKTTWLRIALKPDVIQMSEIVVVEESDKSFDNALLNQRKKSQSISDGISSEQIKKSNDVSASDALKRIPGISLIDNKFIFVRGTSERYSNAKLNNSGLSSTEPEKKSFAFDLIPTNLISNIIVVKSFTPDISGDFAGGTIQINTINFSDRMQMNLGYSISLTSNTSYKSFQTYQGGGEIFGFSNSTRKLPENFPSNLSDGNLKRSEINSLAALLNNVWSPTIRRAPPNQSFSFSLSNSFNLFGNELGFVSAFSFKNSYKNSQLERNEYEASGEPRFAFKGKQSTYSTLMGGLFNLSYKLSESTSVNIKNTYNHTSDDEVSVLNGANFTDAGKEQIQTALRFVEREIFSSEFSGVHLIPSFFNLKIEWKGFYSNARRDEPDYRRVIYGRDLGTDDPFYAILGFQPNLKNGGRYFSHLFEKTKGVSIDLSIASPYGKYKFGGLVERKDRDFSSRLISVIINAPDNGFTDFNLLYLPLDKIFSPENFRRNGFSLDEYQNGTNNYIANHEVISAYGMIEVPIKILNEDLTLITGARLENSLQEINSFDLSGKIPLSYQLKKIDLLPSLNIIHKLSDKSNLRFSYSHTINRPELRELAPFSYYDFSTQTSLTGNPNLRRALVRNYDLRFEVFPSLSELISVSTFYKNITDAIEKVVVSGVSLGSERTFANAEHAKIYGFEFESRVSLGFLGDYFKNLLINGNYSWIKSIVNVKGTQGTLARSNRPLQGQSPYVINLGIFFTEPNTGTSINLMYNKIGKRIIEVANLYQEDVIEQPRDVIDLTISQTLFTNFELKLSIKDLIAKGQIFTQGDKISRVNSSNRTVSVGVSYKIQSR